MRKVILAVLLGRAAALSPPKSPLPTACRASSLDASAAANLQPRQRAPEGPPTPSSPLRDAVRAAPLAIGAAYWAAPAPFDAATSAAWGALSAWEPAQQPLFEAEVASLGFIAWIAGFSGLHLALGPERTRRARFDSELPHDPFSWTRRENWWQWANPLFSYMGSIWLYHQLHAKPPLPVEAPSFGVLSAELLLGIFLYDLLFFPIHLAMHRSKLGRACRIHGVHHGARGHTLNALETVQHSYADGFLQVAVNIVVQQISPFAGFGGKHPFSRVLHNLAVTYLLSEAHSGYDLPWMTSNVFPELLGGAARHERHHASGRVYYQQYFKYLDDWFGFTDEAAAAAVAEGAALEDDAAAAAVAEGAALEGVFGAVKPFIDETLKGEHAERVAAADGLRAGDAEANADGGAAPIGTNRALTLEP